MAHGFQMLPKRCYQISTKFSGDFSNGKGPAHGPSLEGDTKVTQEAFKCDNHTDARLRQRTHKKAYTNWIYFFLDDINKAQTDRCLTLLVYYLSLFIHQHRITYLI